MKIINLIFGKKDLKTGYYIVGICFGIAFAIGLFLMVVTHWKFLPQEVINNISWSILIPGAYAVYTIIKNKLPII